MPDRVDGAHWVTEFVCLHLSRWRWLEAKPFPGRLDTFLRCIAMGGYVATAVLAVPEIAVTTVSNKAEVDRKW